MALDDAGGIDRKQETINVADWNFVGMPDSVADELTIWKDQGQLPHVFPLQHMEAWKRWKVQHVR